MTTPEYSDGPRLVDDVRALRALAHPVRLALIEHLLIDGPLTATEASELVGESPSSCSFHLRQLAKYGFVEETGEGTGRRRPWRITRIGLDVDPHAADPAVRPGERRGRPGCSGSGSSTATAAGRRPARRGRRRGSARPSTTSTRSG